MSETLDVAVLGTGLMGAGMARNLSAAGHRVVAWNRTPSRAEPLARDGVRVVTEAAEAVRDADAVVTMLLDGPAVLDLMRPLAGGLKDGAVWTQTGTVGPDAQAELAALAAGHGVAFFDSPVLGTKSVADSGQLTVLAAGPETGRPVAGRVFDAIGARTIWLDGDLADSPASRLKLVLNNWVIQLTVATGETMALAKALGVNPDGFFEAIDGGGLDVPYLRVKSAAIRSGDFTPAFSVEGAAKDLGLIVSAGRAGGVRLDAAQAGVDRMLRAIELGHGGEDMVAAYFASFGEQGPDGPR